MRNVIAFCCALLLTSPAFAQAIDTIGGFPTPSGAAGGVLSGTYPNPSFANALAIAPASAGTINNMSIGATTPATIKGTTITATSGDIITAATGVAKPITFQTSAVNRWRIGSDNDTESGGNAGSSFFINRYNDAGTFQDQPLVITRSSGLMTYIDPVTLSNAAIILSGVTTGTNADFLCRASDGTVLLQTSACTISSLRFKNPLGPLSRQAALDDVMLMQPVVFTLKDGASNPDRNAIRVQVGMYAEDIAGIDSRLAIYENDGQTPKSYRQEAVLATAIGAIQALKADNDKLRRRIAKLEARK